MQESTVKYRSGSTFSESHTCANSQFFHEFWCKTLCRTCDCKKYRFWTPFWSNFRPSWCPKRPQDAPRAAPNRKKSDKKRVRKNVRKNVDCWIPRRPPEFWILWLLAGPARGVLAHLEGKKVVFAWEVVQILTFRGTPDSWCP